MVIDRDIKKYIVFSDVSIVQALEKISNNKMKVVFLINESGVLEGVVTDGDFRRWVLEQSTIDLNKPISLVANREFNYCNQNDDVNTIQDQLSDRIEYIPILDSHNRLVSVASKNPHYITIGNHVIHDDSPTFIIAEIGNNHNGSLDLAKKLVDEAKLAGADCAKFQMRDMDSLYRNAGNPDDSSEDLGSQYVLDLLSRFQLSDTEFREIFDYCSSVGVIPLCTPWDSASVAKLEDYGMLAFKVASADLTNHDLLQELANTRRPLIISTGMATEMEIQESVSLLKKSGEQFILLHCNSTYPAPFKAINLRYMQRLKALGNCPIGYSGHERGINVAIAAVAKGAKVIEKHFTLDRSMEGNDHKVSLLPNEFKEMVQAIRQVEDALGTDKDRELTQGEVINRESLGKSLVINCDVKVGTEIEEAMIEIRSPGKGLPPYNKSSLIGLLTKRDFNAGDYFYQSDLDGDYVTSRNYTFARDYGIPVRYHDVAEMTEKSNFNLLEFHLSYKDLELDLNDYLETNSELDFIVHSPELFSGDHTMDLCATSESYRKRSILELQRVIEVTMAISEFYPKTKKPLIVLNVGGFSTSGFLSKKERRLRYSILTESLSQINADSVEILPQTMPPFPWHFGGQSFHNLFVDSDEIVEFCELNKYRICLDISHSKLACNYNKVSFMEFIEAVGKYSAHLHIADAKDEDGEGLQIGNGEIDFKLLLKKLEAIAPNASFIPEIWQGHKNGGEGFWIALDKLENIQKIIL